MTKSTVVLIAMTIAVPLATHLKIGKAASSYLPIVLVLDKIVEPGWRGTIIFFLLPQFLSFALIAWWDDLDLFYRKRQPWAGLSAPKSAQLNITLDYLNCRSRICKALVIRDYPVLLLGVGSMLSFLLPLFSASLFYLERSIQPIGTTRGEQHYVWDTTDAELVTTSMHYGIPLSAVTAILRPPKTTDWITHMEAILPFELDILVERSTSTPGSFWQAQTNSLRTKLDCRPLAKSKITWGDLEGGTVKQPQVIDIVLHDGLLFDDGSTTSTIKACGGLFDMDEDLIQMDLKQQKFFCSQWILRSIRASSGPDLYPGWIIPMVMGDLHSRDPQWGPLLRPGCTAMVLLCLPDAYLGSGTVQVTQGVDVRNPLGFITQRRYDRAQEEELPNRISWAFSRMLNDSIHNASTGMSSFAVPEPPIDSMSFVGDLMGYLMYRTLVSHKISIWELEKPVSDIYSTIFAHVVGGSDWLRRNTSSIIEVTQVQWREAFHMRLWVLCLMIILVLFFASTAVPLVWSSGKTYAFPIAPENIENSLFLLYQSTIVDSLKSIPHPEMLTINAFHRQVELLGHKYMFGRYRESDKHYEQFGVDRYEEFEVDQIIAENENPARKEQVRQAKRYRDDSAESESSTSDESNESGDRTNKRRCARARRRDSRHRRDSRPREDYDENNNAQENQPDEREGGRTGSDGEAETSRSIYQRPKPATTRGHRSRDQQNLISLDNFPDTKHLPEPQHKTNDSGTPPRLYTPADFPDLSHLPELIKPSTKDTSHIQPQPPIQDSKLQDSRVPRSARRKATTIIPKSPEGDSKRPEYSVASAGNNLPTPVDTIDSHDDLVRHDSKASPQPEYDSDASLISDIDAFINKMEAEGTIAPANTETVIVGTCLGQNNGRLISASSATAFLIDQSENTAEDRDEDRDEGKIEIAREREHSGELKDDHGSGKEDGSAIQREYEDKGAGNDDGFESANISHPQHSIRSPIVGIEALGLEFKDVSQDENGVEAVYDDGDDQKHVDNQVEDKDKSGSAKHNAYNKGGKSGDVNEAQEKPDDPRLIALPASEIESEDLEEGSTPLLALSAASREDFHTKSKDEHGEKKEEKMTGTNGNEELVENTGVKEVASENLYEGAHEDFIGDVDERPNGQSDKHTQEERAK